MTPAATPGALPLELRRKFFHLLTLVYLAAYHRLGPLKTLRALGAWIVAEGCLEVARLRFPRLNERLIAAFGGIHREGEAERISGVFWTSIGCWTTFFCFGPDPRVVDAAILYLALGDLAAALAGLAWGGPGVVLLGRRKTAAGSLACFAVCLGVGAFLGLGRAASLAGALSAAILEFLPLPIDDNLWIPVGSGLALTAILR